jgi:Fe-S cluster assembly protein SufD
MPGADIHWAQGLYGVLGSARPDPGARPLAALNSAYATDGVLIHVTGGGQAGFADLCP